MLTEGWGCKQQQQSVSLCWWQNLLEKHDQWTRPVPVIELNPDLHGLAIWEWEESWKTSFHPHKCLTMPVTAQEDISQLLHPIWPPMSKHQQCQISQSWSPNPQWCGMGTFASPVLPARRTAPWVLSGAIHAFVVTRRKEQPTKVQCSCESSGVCQSCIGPLHHQLQWLH